MANKVTTPFSNETKLTFNIVTNVKATTQLIGPKEVSTGGPSIPTSGVIWWPRK